MYSVAFETQLPSNLYPCILQGGHFKAANEALNAAIKVDSVLANTISNLGINIPHSATGTILGKSPTNWVWHHAVGTGVMQLVPKVQHTTGSAYWITLHPGGVGGFYLWGR